MKTAPLAALLAAHLQYRTLERVAASAPSPDAFKRRVSEILSGRQATVTLRVADEICIVIGRPDWMQLLEEG